MSSFERREASDSIEIQKASVREQVINELTGATVTQAQILNLIETQKNYRAAWRDESYTFQMRGESHAAEAIQAILNVDNEKEAQDCKLTSKQASEIVYRFTDSLERQWGKGWGELRGFETAYGEGVKSYYREFVQALGISENTMEQVNITFWPRRKFRRVGHLTFEV